MTAFLFLHSLAFYFRMVEAMQAQGGGIAARAQALAPIMVACLDGLALQELAQPALDLRPAHALLQSLLAGAADQDGP